MSRYIDADKLIELSTITRTYNGDSCITVDDIDDCPTEDVAPIKHGEWIGAEYDGYADGNPVYDTWECSICHTEVESEGEPPGFRYCPYCGAKMDGGGSKE